MDLAFQEFTVVVLTLYLAYLDENLLIADAVPETLHTTFLLFQEQPFDTLPFDYRIFVFL